MGGGLYHPALPVPRRDSMSTSSDVMARKYSEDSGWEYLKEGGVENEDTTNDNKPRGEGERTKEDGSGSPVGSIGSASFSSYHGKHQDSDSDDDLHEEGERVKHGSASLRHLFSGAFMSAQAAVPASTTPPPEQVTVHHSESGATTTTTTTAEDTHTPPSAATATTATTAAAPTAAACTGATSLSLEQTVTMGSSTRPPAAAPTPAPAATPVAAPPAPVALAPVPVAAAPAPAPPAATATPPAATAPAPPSPPRSPAQHHAAQPPPPPPHHAHDAAAAPEEDQHAFFPFAIPTSMLELWCRCSEGMADVMDKLQAHGIGHFELKLMFSCVAVSLLAFAVLACVVLCLVPLYMLLPSGAGLMGFGGGDVYGGGRGHEGHHRHMHGQPPRRHGGRKNNGHKSNGRDSLLLHELQQELEDMVAWRDDTNVWFEDFQNMYASNEETRDMMTESYRADLEAHLQGLELTNAEQQLLLWDEVTRVNEMVSALTVRQRNTKRQQNKMKKVLKLQQGKIRKLKQELRQLQVKVRKGKGAAREEMVVDVEMVDGDDEDEMLILAVEEEGEEGSDGEGGGAEDVEYDMVIEEAEYYAIYDDGDAYGEDCDYVLLSEEEIGDAMNAAAAAAAAAAASTDSASGGTDFVAAEVEEVREERNAFREVVVALEKMMGSAILDVKSVVNNWVEDVAANEVIEEAKTKGKPTATTSSTTTTTTSTTTTTGTTTTASAINKREEESRARKILEEEARQKAALREMNADLEQRRLKQQQQQEEEEQQQAREKEAARAEAARGAAGGGPGSDEDEDDMEEALYRRFEDLMMLHDIPSLKTAVEDQMKKLERRVLADELKNAAYGVAKSTSVLLHEVSAGLRAGLRSWHDNSYPAYTHTPDTSNNNDGAKADGGDDGATATAGAAEEDDSSFWDGMFGWDDDDW